MNRDVANQTAADHVDLERALAVQDFASLSKLMNEIPVHSVVLALERQPLKQRAMLYRLLPKEKALRVFEGLDVTLQSDLVQGLRDADVAAVFAEMEADDRVSLLDELPSSVATRLLHGLPHQQRELTAAFLGYPYGSIGRRMSPEYVAARETLTATQVLGRVREHLSARTLSIRFRSLMRSVDSPAWSACAN